MIHIIHTTKSQQTVFQIDGRLTAEDGRVLEKSCSEIGRPHVLDLSKLQSADRTGSQKLREMTSTGVQIRGASRYIQLLMDDVPDETF